MFVRVRTHIGRYKTTLFPNREQQGRSYREFQNPIFLRPSAAENAFWGDFIFLLLYILHFVSEDLKNKDFLASLYAAGKQKSATNNALYQILMRRRRKKTIIPVTLRNFLTNKDFSSDFRILPPHFLILALKLLSKKKHTLSYLAAPCTRFSLDYRFAL